MLKHTQIRSRAKQNPRAKKAWFLAKTLKQLGNILSKVKQKVKALLNPKAQEEKKRKDEFEGPASDPSKDKFNDYDVIESGVHLE